MPGIQQFYQQFPKFCRRIGLISYRECCSLGITPDDMLGSFEPYRLEELTNFCKKNSAYHIVSYCNSVYSNFPIVDAMIYFLADGDSNPNLSIYSPLVKYLESS